MSTIKSFAVGNGDMFYIDHNSDNFTIIDCCLGEENGDAILEEIGSLRNRKGISRFISTHPDEDHIRGLGRLQTEVGIQNFYVVKNAATKETATDSFETYCELRDSAKAFYIHEGCSRRWMNQKSEERGSSGLNIVWPDINNKNFTDALANAEAGESPNNISAIVKYSIESGASFLWMGDLEADFLEAIEDAVVLPQIDILFPPHHGRNSGRVPQSMLDQISPKIIVVGEALSQHLHYYADHNTITQNSAGDIVFVCDTGKVHIFTSNEYEVDFLDDEQMTKDGYHYLGTLNL